MEVIEVTEREIEVIEVIERGPQGPQGAGITTLTTQGDLLYRGATTGERLPIGTTGQILKVSSGGIPEWGAAPSSGVSSISGTSPIVSSGGATPAISITAATTSAAGSMSAADKTKLDGIASGAEVNVNADWNASSGDAQILNKPTIPSTAADVGAVPTSRTISAGTGLTGGGDLSANRTLAVTYGTTAGTACQGNDTRLSDSRTPTSHASSHQASGGDQITSLDMTSLTVTNASNSPQVKLKAKTFFGNSTGTVGVLAESTSIFGSEPAFGFTGVNEAVSAYKNIGFSGSGTSQLILNRNGNIAINNTFPTEILDVNGNLLLRDTNAETKAIYDGTPDGASSGVIIEALAFGVNGNDIEIIFDGDNITINDAINTWNEANPSNRAYLASGDGTQIPNAGSVFLSGGVSASGTFNILEGLTGKRIYVLPDKDGTLAVTSDITKTAVGLGNVTNNAQTQASIVPNTAPSAGQLLVGNAGGTAYAPASVSGDATLSSTGALTLANNSTARSNLGLGNSATLNTGTTAGTVAAGDHTHSQLHDRSHAITSTSDHTAGNNKVFYSSNTGVITELALGAANTVLTSNGASSAPSFAAVSTMTGATASAAGSAGLVPQPPAGSQGKILFGDSTFSSNVFPSGGEYGTNYVGWSQIMGGASNNNSALNVNGGLLLRGASFYPKGTFNRISVYVSAGSAGKNAKIGIYEIDENGYAGSLITSGIVGLDNAGFAEASVSNFVLSTKWYITAMIIDTTGASLIYGPQNTTWCRPFDAFNSANNSPNTGSNMVFGGYYSRSYADGLPSILPDTGYTAYNRTLLFVRKV